MHNLYIYTQCLGNWGIFGRSFQETFQLQIRKTLWHHFSVSLSSKFPIIGGIKVLAYLNSHIQRRQWHPTPALLPGKSYGRRSLVGCSPWGREESDTTEWLHFHFSLSCIGEGNGNPLQCSCLENPRDGGAWWAAIYGIYAQSRTRLKQLSSSKLTYYVEVIDEILNIKW